MTALRHMGVGMRGYAGGAPRVGLLLATIVGFVAAGVPLVAFGWHNLNHLLAGEFTPGRLAIVLGAAAGLAGVMYGLGRVVNVLAGIP
jgi:hypothetical protein